MSEEHWKSLRPPRPGQTLRRDEIGTFLERTHHSDARMRRRALQHLCPCHVKADIERVWDRVIALVEDVDPGVRGAAVHALGDGSPRSVRERALRALEIARNDADRKVRRMARRLLAHHEKTGRLDAL